jgi:hypothetical protein
MNKRHDVFPCVLLFYNGSIHGFDLDDENILFLRGFSVIVDLPAVFEALDILFGILAVINTYSIVDNGTITLNNAGFSQKHILRDIRQEILRHDVIKLQASRKKQRADDGCGNQPAELNSQLMHLEIGSCQIYKERQIKQ